MSIVVVCTSFLQIYFQDTLVFSVKIHYLASYCGMSWGHKMFCAFQFVVFFLRLSKTVHSPVFMTCLCHFWEVKNWLDHRTQLVAAVGDIYSPWKEWAGVVMLFWADETTQFSIILWHIRDPAKQKGQKHKTSKLHSLYTTQMHYTHGC